MKYIDPELRKREFESIYDSCYDRIYRYARMLLLNKEDAEDITSDTFIAAYLAFDSFDPSKASAITWLTRIAHNKAVNLMRSAAFTRNDALEDELIRADTTDIAGDVENADFVTRLYSRLQPSYRDFLNLRYVLDLKDGEIAELTGLQVKTVNKRFQRLLEKCRKLMTEG